MTEVTAPAGQARTMARTVAMAGGGYLAGYAVLSSSVSALTGAPNVALGDLAQLFPPVAFAALALHVAQLSRGQVRLFWNLSACYALIWAAGQVVWTYYDLFAGGVPVMSPTDPIFFASSIPLAAALYGRPERDRPRWLFEIILLDIVLIALFGAFVYIYFVVSIAVTDGPEDLYNANVTQLFNARNLLLAIWAGWLWHTATDAAWRRVLAIFSLGLAIAFAGGVVYDVVEYVGTYIPGALWDLGWMAPFVVLSIAAAVARDRQLFAPVEQMPHLARMPVVSLIAIALLVLIPTTDEIVRRLMSVSPETAMLRTRLALSMMIPFGIVVVVREFLSRRALLRAGQELVTTREQLAQTEKLAAVGQLVSGVAHELNNPLQGVLGYAELMAASHPGEEASEELRAIHDNATRAAGIVRNLLTFAGKETPARSWHQVNRLVREAVLKREPRLKSAGTAVRLHLAERLPLIYLDGLRFEEVMHHLLENALAAITARRQGQVLSVRVPPDVPGEIAISTRHELHPERIVIEVSDNGSGVRADDLSRIFDPFFTTRGPRGGAGLGLSVCYGIIREHGGQISGRNRETGGATLSVELPVAAESFVTATPQAEALQAVPSARAPRALVVDDEDSNAALVRRVLDQAGYEVESTTLSRRALVMIERTPYDVVIADVKMPELSGQELYERARQIRPEMARRFIFITGDIDGVETREFLEGTQCGYFMKPFNLDRLTAAVDTLVGRAQEPQPPQ